MKNINDWKQKRFLRDKKGRIIGTHMDKIIGNAYEPVIAKYASGKMADIGCGNVPYYYVYRGIVSETTCVDWANGLDHSYLDYEADLNQGMPFLFSESFDTVLCADVLEHIHTPHLLFTEMARILKKDGNLILTVPFLYWIHDGPHDYHRYTHFMLKEFCQRNNMEVVELQTYGGFPEIVYDLIYKAYNAYNLPMKKAFYLFWRTIGMFLYRRSFIKKLSQYSKPVFPMGYILVARKIS